MMSANRGARPGFTLIELMTVIILVGILFSVSFQGFQNARDRSTNSQVDGNVRTIAQALMAFEADNEKFPEALVRVGATGPGAATPAATICLLDATLDRRYLPGNLLPKTPWTDCWQGNNLTLPAFNRNAGIWPITRPETVTDVVRVPANPAPIGQGSLPTDGAARAVLFTNRTFGAILYEATPTARDKYMLVGVGKNRRDARVVALSTNAN